MKVILKDDYVFILETGKSRFDNKDERVVAVLPLSFIKGCVKLNEYIGSGVIR